jgi:DNA replication protein DnaC
MEVQAALTQIVSASIESLGSSDRHCTVCGRRLEARTIDLPGIGRRVVPVACRCETEQLKREENKAALRERNGNLHNFSDDDQMVAGATFANYKPEPGTARGYQVAKDFAENVEEWGPRGFYLYGDNGSGKSHLLSAVVNHLRQRGYSAIYTTAKTLIQNAKPAAAKAEVLNAYKVCDVLVIDEIGADVPANWEIGDLFTVMNARQGRRPVLYGSNFSIRDLEARMNERQVGWGTRLMERIIADTADQIEMRANSERFKKMGRNKKWLEGRLNGNA